jgi:hypothetical protein
VKLSEARIDKLSLDIIDTLAEQDDVRLQAKDAELSAAVKQIVEDELLVEERLEAEVRQLLEEHRSEIVMSRLSYDELFRRTKQRLINERRIVL